MSKDTKKEPKTFVIDIDGTICSQETVMTYHLAEPRTDVIKKINSLYAEKHRIILFTARGMNTYDGNVDLIESELRSLTEKWLTDNRVCYDELIFGKPPADYYVDDKNLDVFNFLYKSEQIFMQK